jgi:hypothetical protein
MSAPPTPTPSRHAWLREPLLHFAVLGALLFGIDAWVSGRQDDPRIITVDASVDGEALSVFRSARGRDPNEDELYALRRIWLDNEVLYREGIALQMDKGDKAIRDRVIFKALTAVNAGLQLPAFDDESLRAWFEKNRVRYDEPPRYDFLEAVLSGDAAEADATALAAQLNGGGSGDAKAGLRVFKGRPHANLVQSYGEPFAQALQAAPVGRWQALPQGGVWRVVQLQSLAPAKPAEFEPLRGVVLQDWKDTVMAEQRTAAVRALAKKYEVRVTAEAPK